MRKALCCLSVLGVLLSIGVVTSIAAPYSAPEPISTPSFDTDVLEGYSGDVGGVNVQYTIETDGSVSDVHLLGSTGSDAVDAAIEESVSSWQYKPATDSDGNPVESTKTKYIDLDV